MSGDGAELLPWLSGPGAIVLWKAGGWVVSRFVRKAESAEEQLEQLEASKLDLVLEKVTAIEIELSDLRHEAKATAGRQAQIESAVAEVRGRIDGVSNNHGPAIDALKQTVARYDERLKALELSTRRRSR